MFAPKKAKGKPPSGKKPPFEKSDADVEPSGMTEGSPQEEAFDRKQMKAKKPAMPMFKKGGSVTGVGERERERAFKKGGSVQTRGWGAARKGC